MSLETSSVAPARRAKRASPRAAGEVVSDGREQAASPVESQSADDPHAAENAYAAISKALLEGQLKPGTPMRERQLAQVFGLTRGAVRKLLLRLVHDGKLQSVPNRGAFVPKPSTEDIRHVYAARKAVEAGMVALLAADITPSQLATLRAHVCDERSVERQGRRDECVKLAGGFHLLLVEILANPELEAVVRRLVARTQMFVALFELPRDSGCAPEEHEAIVAALSTRGAAHAAATMLQHLTHVENRVLRSVGSKKRPHVVDILRAALAENGSPIA